MIPQLFESMGQIDPKTVGLILMGVSSLIAWVCFLSSHRANKRLLKICQSALNEHRIAAHRAHVYQLRLRERQSHDRRNEHRNDPGGEA